MVVDDLDLERIRIAKFEAYPPEAKTVMTHCRVIF
jgi:hypothetical protein